MNAKNNFYHRKDKALFIINIEKYTDLIEDDLINDIDIYIALSNNHADQLISKYYFDIAIIETSHNDIDILKLSTNLNNKESNHKTPILFLSTYPTKLKLEDLEIQSKDIDLLFIPTDISILRYKINEILKSKNKLDLYHKKELQKEEVYKTDVTHLNTESLFHDLRIPLNNLNLSYNLLSDILIDNPQNIRQKTNHLLFIIKENEERIVKFSKLLNSLQINHH